MPCTAVLCTCSKDEQEGCAFFVEQEIAYQEMPTETRKKLNAALKAAREKRKEKRGN